MVDLDWSSASEEELQKVLDSINEELAHRLTVSLEEAKAKAVIAIRDLVTVCEKCNIRTLGRIYWECVECDHDNYFDLLQEDILEDVAKIIENSK